MGCCRMVGERSEGRPDGGARCVGSRLCRPLRYRDEQDDAQILQARQFVPHVPDQTVGRNPRG